MFRRSVVVLISIALAACAGGETDTVEMADATPFQVTAGTPFEDIPEEVWRNYRKGDRGIFERRLLRNKSNISIPEIETHYASDERFQNQVTRYMSQFESLLTQASDCDPEQVLSATFLTADVGKLYLLLSRSLGRTQ